MGCKLHADLNHLKVMTHTKVGWVPCWGLGCKVPPNMDKNVEDCYIKLIPLPLSDDFEDDPSLDRFHKYKFRGPIKVFLNVCIHKDYFLLSPIQIINELEENQIQSGIEPGSLTYWVAPYHYTTSYIFPQPSQSIHALVSKTIYSVLGVPSQNLTGTMYKHVNAAST